jgi:hypothetical protein
MFETQKAREEFEATEAWVLMNAVQIEPGWWIFGSAIDFEDRHMAPFVDRYFACCCPVMPNRSQRASH